MTPQHGAVSTRIASIDVLRGIVVVLMAIDHVRVFSGLPAGGPSPAIFFTRWITHFVAPVFVFLAGTSAFLHGRTLGDRRALARFLLTRGLWLVFLELTVIRISWTFNLDFANYVLAGVIWVIGWSMVVLAGLVLLPAKAVGGFGLLLIAGHNIMDAVARPHLDAIGASRFNWLWSLGYFAFEVPFDGPLVVLYSLVPWVGVMAAGYAFGTVFTLDPAQRRRVCLRIGGTAIALFLLLRFLDLYGDPRHWQRSPSEIQTVLAFLNTSKYPASLVFLLMTLGPAVLLLPFLEHATSLNARGAPPPRALARRLRASLGPQARLTRVMAVFGRVPMFYYLLHIPLIHLLAIGVSRIRTGSVSAWLFENHPMGNGPAPPGYTWSLGLLYLVTAAAVVLLYFPCRWFGAVKARRKDRWLSYL